MMKAVPVPSSKYHPVPSKKRLFPRKEYILIRTSLITAISSLYYIIQLQGISDTKVQFFPLKKKDVYLLN